MDSPGELHNFVRKFESLWKSGCHAKLFVETEAGNAFVHLQVGLGQAQQHPQNGQVYVGGRRGGGPARERRREKRFAERQATVAAEEAVEVAQIDENNFVAEEATANSDAELDVSGDMTEQVRSKIPQIDGTADSDVYYKLQIETHETCTQEEVIEALEANFFETISDKKEGGNEYIHHLFIENLDVESLLETKSRKFMNFKIAVKDDDKSTALIESWNERYNFDELAFKNYDYENKSIRIEKATRL